MSLSTHIAALTAKVALAPVDVTNTASGTSAFIDVTGYEGQLGVLIVSATIGSGGTATYTFQTATDDEGTGVATITPVATPVVASEANDPLVQICTFNTTQLKGFLKVIGTVETDAGLSSYLIIGQKKYAS